MKKSLPILLIIVTFWLLELTGCKPTQRTVTADINREIFGSWSDDQGCTAILLPMLTADNNGIHQLILKSFKDNNHHLFKNITLTAKKYGVATQIKADAATNAIEFSGSYQEGILLIDKYCAAPLHKVSN
ncbi:MAG: hypothetical protein QG673_2078 [Pseudomonadota bacterium]|nr:hypothetical protein [Pseudomonadota bacterium]